MRSARLDRLLTMEARLAAARLAGDAVSQEHLAFVRREREALERALERAGRPTPPPGLPLFDS